MHEMHRNGKTIAWLCENWLDWTNTVALWIICRYHNYYVRLSFIKEEGIRLTSHPVISGKK